MKRKSLVLTAIVAALLVIPQLCTGQSRFKSKYIRYVDEARHKAITNTLIPVAAGVGAAHFIESRAIQTSGSIMAMYGLVVGPSTGNIYARDYLRGVLGMAVRLGGGYLMKDATRELFGDNVADVVGWDKKEVSIGDPRVLIGAGLIVGSAIYNVISAKASVHRFNKLQGYYIRPSAGYKNGRIVPMLSGTVRF